MIRLNPTYIFLAILAGIALFVVYDAKYNYVDWRTANRSSAGIAPNPRVEKQAVVQVYTARTYNWRGYFAVHPWIAVKKKDQNFYTVYQVTAWNLRNGRGAVSVEKDLPDRYWYGNRPQLLQSLIGEAAEKAIPAIEKAAAAYPYADRYKLWPGPRQK